MRLTINQFQIPVLEQSIISDNNNDNRRKIIRRDLTYIKKLRFWTSLQNAIRLVVYTYSAV